MRRMAEVDGLFGLLMTDAAGPSAADLVLIEEMQEAEDAFEQKLDDVVRQCGFNPPGDSCGMLRDILEMWGRVRRARAAAGY